jgi:hypothetical protein
MPNQTLESNRRRRRRVTARRGRGNLDAPSTLKLAFKAAVAQVSVMCE